MRMQTVTCIRNPQVGARDREANKNPDGGRGMEGSLNSARNGAENYVKAPICGRVLDTFQTLNDNDSH